MSENKGLASSLPGYGLLAVAVSILFGVASVRKDGDKKPDPEKGPAAEVSRPGTESSSQSIRGRLLVELGLGKAPVRGHLQFLAERGILSKAGPPAELPFPLRTEFLILTLPDPLGSQLGYLYDQSIDALTRAMGDHGYALSDRWFPWAVESEDKSKGLVTRYGDPAIDPAVVVYTKNDNADDRLVILVVGENPTTGLRMNALEAALHLAAMSPTGADGTIRLIGPCFTGSQATLGRTLLNWSKKRQADKTKEMSVQCITGTAMGIKPWHELLPSKAKEKRLGDVCDPITGTQVPFKDLDQVALHYLLDGHPVGKVAYLVEANSGYGEVAIKSVDPDSQDKQPSGLGERPNRPPSQRSLEANHKGDQRLIFRFPMHIGRLAGIRSKEERERDERLGLIKPGDGRLAALDEARTGGDLVPAADETRTALINQRLLDDYWSVIRRERVRYVFVVATDTRDHLFLLEQIQTACPEAQPVVFGADLQYVHPDYVHFTRGVMIVGTYPLYPRAQRWQAAHPTDSRRTPFPSSNAEGVYNAVLASLGETKKMADYLPPRFGPAGRGKPPVWVTTVGENGEFVPLAYFTNHHTEDDFLVTAKEPAEQARTPDSPFTRSFFYLAGWIVAAILAGALYLGRWGPRISRSRAPATAGRNVDPAWAPGLRARYVLLASIGAVFATLPLVLAFWSADRDENLADLIFLYMTIAVLVVVPLATIAVLIEQWRLARTRSAQIDPLMAFLDFWRPAAFALLLGGIVFGWLLVDHWRLSQVARYLFAERAADLFSGYSPVVPAAVVALGLLGYGLLGLGRTRVMTEFHVTTPYPDWISRLPAGMDGQGVVVGAVRRIQNLACEIDSQSRTLAGVFADPGGKQVGWWLRPVVWSAGLLLVVGAVLWAWSRDPEGWWFAHLLFLAIIWLILLLVGTALALVRKRVPRMALAWPRLGGSLLLVAVGIACAIALHRSQPTWESQAWNCLFATGFLALAFLTMVAGYRLFLLWKQVEKMTQAIATIPMAGTFDRFPHKVSQVFGAYLLSSRRRTLDLAIPDQILRQLREALQNAPTDDERAGIALAAIPPDEPPGAVDQDELNGQEANVLCEIAANLVDALAPGWALRPVPEAFGTVPPEAGHEAEPPGGWRGLAEQLVAIMAVIFLSQFLVRIRYLAYMALTASASMLIAITAYQFEPERFLMYSAVGFAGSVIVLLVWVLYRINRNELVSRVTRTTPDKFQLDSAFVQNVVVLVLPLLFVVVTQLAGRMRSVVEPILGWLR